MPQTQPNIAALIEAAAAHTAVLPSSEAWAAIPGLLIAAGVTPKLAYGFRPRVWEARHALRGVTRPRRSKAAMAVQVTT